MKRRNFFSKIVKGLLGIGIVTALPTPEVETVLSDTPQNLSAKELDNNLNIFRQTLNRNRHNVHAYTVSGVDSQKGMVEIGNKLYIVESESDCNGAITYPIDSLPEGLEHKHTVIGSESGKEYAFGVRGAKANRS